MTPICFVDCETTGLDPDRHEIWELAIIHRVDGKEDHEHCYQFPVDLSRADPGALRISHYYERADRGAQFSPREWAPIVASMLAGAHIVGAVPSFDAGFLERWLRAHDQAPAWHYHLIDVEALAVGYINGSADRDRLQPVVTPPWKSHDLSDCLGIRVPEEDEHTALGDARWARAIYDRVMGVAS